LIKALYKRLFEQTVQRINNSFAELRPKGAPTNEEDGEEGRNHIGILDSLWVRTAAAQFV